MAELELRNYRNRHSLGSKVVRAVWNVVWAVLFWTTLQGRLAVENV